MNLPPQPGLGDRNESESEHDRNTPPSACTTSKFREHIADVYPPYPRRQYYIARLTKFARRVRAAGPSDLGTAALVLVLIVASIEDDAFGMRPVEVWAADLAAECGYSVSTMERARDVAVARGWLGYTPGRRHIPAIYSTSIPAALRDQFDVLYSGRTDVRAPLDRQTDGVSDGLEAVEKGLDRQTDGVSDGVSDGPSSLFPIPPEERAPTASAPARGKKTTKPKTEPKPATSAHSEAVKIWCDLWGERHGKKCSFDRGKDGTLLKWMLGELGGDVTKFRSAVQHYLADSEQYLVRQQHPLGLLRSQFNKHKPIDRPTASQPQRLTAEQAARLSRGEPIGKEVS